MMNGMVLVGWGILALALCKGSILVVRQYLTND